MSRDKSIWFGEEILLDGALIHYKLGAGEWVAVEDMLRAEAQLSRDPETGRLRPKKASEYTLRLIGEFLHIMRVNIEDNHCQISSLGVAEQCLRLIRSCAAYGMKIQTYICKDLNILDDMLDIFTKYQHHCEDIVDEEVLKHFDFCMVALTQTLGNLVVNNPFNQIIIWDKLGTNILNALLGQNEKIASCAAMIVYNILLGQPNVLPDDVFLLNALAYMYAEGNSEFPHLIIEYLIGVENSYIEKLYNRLEPDTKILILNLAYNILTCIETQDINVSVNFIKFISHEFKIKSDCILKTVDKYVNSIEPQEVVYLLDIIATASSMEAYMECLQSDISLFINCAFLLRSIHTLGKQEDNFFTSIHKLYNAAGKTVPVNNPEIEITEPSQEPVRKCDSTDMLQCNETISECTESESSEQYYECTDQIEQHQTQPPTKPEIVPIAQILPDINANPPNITTKPDKISNLPFFGQTSIDRKFSDSCKIDENLIKVAFAKNIRLEDQMPVNQIDTNPTKKANVDHTDDLEPPLITDSPEEMNQSDQKNLIKKISLDMSISRRDSIDKQVMRKESSRPVSRQQSVERGIEASETVIREMTINMQQPDIIQPMINAQQIQSIEQVAQNVEIQQTKVASEPTPIKKPQNIATEFDLNEQLQKILGISADKAVRSDSLDVGKETPHVQTPHIQAPILLPTVQPAQPVVTPVMPTVQNTETIITQTPKVQMKIPNVKIDSPENQNNKLGNFENTGPKRVASIIVSAEQHVAFGFKATLVRTIGNLCWKNQINKRKVRELEVIPVLLDCCNIDARNPLIMQWVIFAVRNLCENCSENQALISSMTLQEPLNNEILEEMGLTLHTDSQNNSIKLVPLLKKGN